MRARLMLDAVRLAFYAVVLVGPAGCGDDHRTVVFPGGESPGTAGGGPRFEDQGGPRFDDPWALAPDAGPPPEPFSMPFAGLVENRVRWANVFVSVLGARIERGMDDLYLWPWRSEIDAAQIYVELDVRIENRKGAEVDYSGRDTWDLILAGGERLRPAAPLDVAIAPGDAPVVQLHYFTNDVVDLAGAALELNGDERGRLEPEHIPLDEPHERRHPLHLPELAGVVIEPVLPMESADILRFEVLQARYGLDDPEEGRAQAGTRFVSIDLITTVVNRLIGVPYVRDGAFRLIVDGRAQQPVSWIDKEVPSGIDVPVHVVFAIDAAVRTFEVAFSTHYGAELQRIAVNLDNGVLVEP